MPRACKPRRRRPLFTALAAWAAALVSVSCTSLGTPSAECAAAAAAAPDTVQDIAFLGSTTIVREPGTLSEHLGGISGLEYDAARGQWLLLSDDRAERAPARLYRAELALSAQGPQRVRLAGLVTLPIPPGERPDPEALRALPGTCLLAWASEGAGAAGVPPSVRLITHEGLPAGELALPEVIGARPAPHQGPRDNLSLEGLAAAPGAGSLWVSMEAPLLQDGPLADLQRGAAVRFVRLPLAGGPAAQFVYLTDAIPRAATGGRRRADNGVSEILQLGAQRLLVVERSGREVAEGRFAYDVRLYEADAEAATDVAALVSLAGADVVPMRKRLLLASDAPGLRGAGNVEAAAWGPRLADGRATLLLATDDNFVDGEWTQLLLFAVR